MAIKVKYYLIIQIGNSSSIKAFLFNAPKDIVINFYGRRIYMKKSDDYSVLTINPDILLPGTETVSDWFSKDQPDRLNKIFNNDTDCYSKYGIYEVYKSKGFC
jgi:hypothetical protein